MFSWQPRARAAATAGLGYEKVLSYCGPGRRWLYRFAETRTLPDTPRHEPECLAWTNPQAHRAEIEALMKRAEEAAKAELGGGSLDLLNYRSLGALNDPAYNAGRPDLLRPDPSPRPSRFWPTPAGGRKRVVLCVRDRALSDHRNWPKDDWRRLVGLLLPDHDIVIVGTSSEPIVGQPTEGVTDATGRTTIDDLIELFSQADLAVGGSTGTMHLASRCGCDHLVWGAENSTAFPLSARYAETNWFGASCRVITDHAWEPTPEAIHEAVKTHRWREKGRKGRVIVTFVDCTDDQVSAASLMSNLGLRGTFAAVTNLVGTPGFPSWDTLLTMRRAGHCVCNHSASHALLAPDGGRPTLKPVGKAGIVADAVAGREHLNRRGLDGDFYIVPFGTENLGGPDTLEKLTKLFRWVRVTNGAPLQDGQWSPAGFRRLLPLDYYGKVYGNSAVADCRWPNEVREKMDEAALVGATCVICYHRVTSVVGRAQDVRWVRFASDMDHLSKLVKDGKVDVVTPKEIL